MTAPVPLATDRMGWPELFTLERDTDVTEVSGTGRVAAGVRWPDNRVSFRWTGQRPPPGHPCTVHQVATYPDLDGMRAVHGHGGLTRVVHRPLRQYSRRLGVRLFALIHRYGGQDALTWWGVAWDDADALLWRRTLPHRPGAAVPMICHWPGGAQDAYAEECAAVPASIGVELVWLPEGLRGRDVWPGDPKE